MKFLLVVQFFHLIESRLRDWPIEARQPIRFGAKSCELMCSKDKININNEFHPGPVPVIFFIIIKIGNLTEQILANGRKPRYVKKFCLHK